MAKSNELNNEILKLKNQINFLNEKLLKSEEEKNNLLKLNSQYHTNEELNKGYKNIEKNFQQIIIKLNDSLDKFSNVETIKQNKTLVDIIYNLSQNHKPIIIKTEQTEQDFYDD